MNPILIWSLFQKYINFDITRLIPRNSVLSKLWPYRTTCTSLPSWIPVKCLSTSKKLSFSRIFSNSRCSIQNFIKMNLYHVNSSPNIHRIYLYHIYFYLLYFYLYHIYIHVVLSTLLFKIDMLKWIILTTATSHYVCSNDCWSTVIRS